jgi:hypothetical protein
MLNILPAYVVLCIAAVVIASDAFVDLFTHVNEILFSPLLAVSVGLVLLAKYSYARNRAKQNNNAR